MNIIEAIFENFSPDEKEALAGVKAVLAAKWDAAKVADRPTIEAEFTEALNNFRSALPMEGL